MAFDRVIFALDSLLWVTTRQNTAGSFRSHQIEDEFIFQGLVHVERPLETVLLGLGMLEPKHQLLLD